MKSTRWFVNEVNKRLQANPEKAIRLDVGTGEEKAAREAWRLLTSDTRRVSCRWSQHANPALRHQGLMRVAFFGPGYRWPEPVTVIRHEWPEAKTEKAAVKRGIATRMRLEKLQREYGSDYHIEWIFHQFLFRVWRGEDWLAVNTAAFYPAEVALLLQANVTEARWMEPDAEYGKRKQRQITQHNRAVARQGGKATAVHDDAAIQTAMRDYKRAPGSRAGITAAVNAVSEKLGYANPGALWRRLRGMAGKKGASALYKAL